MAQFACQCPRCHTQLNVATPVPPKVRCPNCSQVLALQAKRQPQPAPAPTTTQPPVGLPSSQAKWTRKPAAKQSSMVVPAIIGGLVFLLLFIGAATAFYLFSRSERPQVAKKELQNGEAVNTATDGSVTDSSEVAVNSNKAAAALPKTRKPAQPRQATETREQVMRDALVLFEKIEKQGLSFAEDDQSEETAEKLLEWIPEVEAVVLRGCQLATVDVNFQESQKPLQYKASKRSSPRQARPDRTFWHLRVGNNQPVFGATNRLTSHRAAFFDMLGRGITELPSPLDLSEEEVEWTDEDRRILEIIRSQGQLSRDFAHCLAPVDVENPSENDLSLLHAVIDKYTERAREIKRLPGKSGILAQVPRKTPYQQQSRAAFIAALQVKAILFGDSMDTVRPNADPELSWLVEEFIRTRDMLEDLSFFSGKRTSVPTLDSWGRYKAKIKAEREAELAKQREREAAEKKAEQDRLAKAERRRKLEEERKRDRKKAEEQRRQMAEQRKENRNNRFAGGPPFGPGRRGQEQRPDNGFPMGPPQGFGGRGGAAIPVPEPQFGPPRFGRRFGAGEENRDTSNDVTIRIQNAKNKDTKAISDAIPKWLRSYSISVINSNGKMRVVVRDFDKELKELEKAFPDLSFESIDNESREIIAVEK